MVNDIRNNTISETDAKKDLIKLNQTKNAGIIKSKKRTHGHKKLLNLFSDLLDIILTDKALESESQENENENEKVENRKEKNENYESENEDRDYENENEDEYEYENEDDDDETMDINKKSEIIKERNYPLNEMIDKSKSLTKKNH